MSVRPVAAIGALTLLLIGSIFYVQARDDDKLEYEHRNLVLDASQINALHALTGAGKLRIVGVEGQQNITVEADIHRYDEVEPELKLVMEDGHASFIARFNESASWWHDSPYIDVVLTVPANLALSVKDGSGPIAIKRMSGDMEISDGSGSLHIDGGNNLVIRDGSGSIELRHINGNIALKDGSGSITIRDCGGDVKIADGSGSIEVNQIAGAVTINDGSGSINVTRAKSLNIVESGSGSVNYRDIEGEVSVN